MRGFRASGARRGGDLTIRRAGVFPSGVAVHAWVFVPLRRHLLVGLVVVIGLLLTSWLHVLARNSAEKAAAQRFRVACDRATSRFEGRLRGYASALTWGRTLLHSDRVNRDAWARFVADSELAAYYPGVFGIAFVERVPDFQADAFVAEVRAEGVPDFAIRSHPRTDRSAGFYHYVIRYHEPALTNRAAWGLDAATWSVNRDVYDRACLTGAVQLSKQMQLAQTGVVEQGLVMAIPVYRPGWPTNTPAERLSALRGWVGAPIGMEHFFRTEDIFDRERLALTLYDDGHTGPDPLFESAAEGRDHRIARTRVSFGGNSFTLAFRPAHPEAFAADLMAARMTAGGGVVFCALLGTVVWTLTVTRLRAERIAAGMAVSLQRSEREACELAQRAEAASHAKSRFLANMSHEIRTPMTAILGYADLLGTEEDASAADRRNYVRTIRRNGEHLLRLINNVLDLSQIEAGRLLVEPQAVQLWDLVGEVADLLRERAEAKRLRLSCRIAPQVPRWVRTDPLRLRQILVNLVGNAIKFTSVGEVRIDVSAGPRRDGRTPISIGIQDTGPGMPAEVRARLFSAFSQGDPSLTRRVGGTGLGLSISGHLAKVLGGRIDVESEPGQGSSFTVRIDFNTAEPPTASGRRAAPQAARIDLSGQRILFVEDGPDNQRLIAHLLRTAGARVVLCENGAAALESLTQDGTVTGPLREDLDYDLILTDMQMPVMDGYTFARRLRSAGWKRPIVALTAHAMRSDAADCFEAGCSHYLGKPVKRTELLEVCANAAAEASRPVPA